MEWSSSSISTQPFSLHAKSFAFFFPFKSCGQKAKKENDEEESSLRPQILTLLLTSSSAVIHTLCFLLKLGRSVYTEDVQTGEKKHGDFRLQGADGHPHVHLADLRAVYASLHARTHVETHAQYGVFVCIDAWVPMYVYVSVYAFKVVRARLLFSDSVEVSLSVRGVERQLREGFCAFLPVYVGHAVTISW